MPIRFDVEDSVRTVFFDGDLDLREFEDYLQQLEHWMATGLAYGLIYDLTESAIPPRAIRVRKGQWLKEHRTRLQELNNPVAFVIPNAAMRFVLSSIFALGPMSGEYCVVATIGEGQAFVRNELAGRLPDPMPPRA